MPPLLTAEQAMDIFLAHGRQKVIAARFGVNQTMVAKIKARAAYAGVTAIFDATALNGLLASVAFTKRLT